jgi:hypothetical protein
MKAGRRGAALLILYLRIKCGLVVNFTSRPLYPEKEPPSPAADWAGWASLPVWTFWKIEKSVHPAGIWNRNRGIVALPPTLSRLCPNFIIVIIIIIIIINCNWVDTRWQWLFYMCTKYDIDYY